MPSGKMAEKVLRRDAFPIPANTHPIGTRCIQVSIPDDIEWEELFFSCLTLLTKWNSYQQDGGHLAADIASIWRSAIWKTFKHCDGPSPIKALVGIEEDFEMPLRVDCDCNVFVTCCDGTEKQILTSEQVKDLIEGQPGSGSKQPPANGGTACYNGTMPASGHFLIPTPVSTGDIITLNVSGAGSDGTLVRWFCPDGNTFFAGTCGGIPIYDAGDPVPTAPHMSFIINLGGTFYTIPIGSAFSIPGGVTDVQPVLQINDSTLATNGGQYTIDVCVTNNATTQFTHHFDFRTGTYGWLQNLIGGHSNAVWTPGSGYSSSIINVSPLAGEGVIDIHMNAPRTLAHIILRVIGYTASGSPNGQALYLNPGGYPPQTVGEVYGQNVTGAIDFSHTFVNSDSSVALQIVAGTVPGQTCTLTDAYITADGTDPF